MFEFDIVTYEAICFKCLNFIDLQLLFNNRKINSRLEYTSKFLIYTYIPP